MAQVPILHSSFVMCLGLGAPDLGAVFGMVSRRQIPYQRQQGRPGCCVGFAEYGTERIVQGLQANPVQNPSCGPLI